MLKLLNSTFKLNDNILTTADCEDPTCSGHGFCVEGSCVCRKGWRGTSCAQMDHEARQCLPDCSGHGEFDLDTQKCVCRGHWTGSDCSKGTLKSCNIHKYVYFNVKTL